MKSLIPRLRICIIYLVLWLVYFTISRIAFLLYYSDLLEFVDSSTQLQSVFYGMKLDLSMAAYLSVIPFLIIALSVWIPNKISKAAFYFFTGFLLILINMLMFFDLGLYGTWDIRLDAMFLSFLNTPKSMFASVPSAVLVSSVIFWILSTAIYFYGFKKVMDDQFAKLNKGKVWHFGILIIAMTSLIIPMRGGLQTIPINQSDVYFSDEMIANHVAENFAWTFAKSASYNVHDGENPFLKLEEDDAQDLVQKSLINANIDDTNPEANKLLATEKPNVIILLWESLTAKIVEPLGGHAGVTQNLNSLIKEGILFDSIYANGSRSDKGIVALLSGYYPQPGQSIMKMPTKSRSLPSLPEKMSDLGYSSSFHYGGDLNFGNMVSYLRNMGIQNLVNEDDFKRSERNSKWGAHDHVLLNRYIEEKTRRKEDPFFDIIFTLSSHEPFEFPGDYKFGKDTDLDRFKSAHAYTDKAVGEFIASAKTQDWWENTLVIIVADHGHTLPRQNGSHVAPSRFHIPMVWLGGAVAKKDTIISTVGSQIDLSYTLLSILGGEKLDFVWSQNLISPSNNPYAHYIFTNGYGTVDAKGCAVFDYNADQQVYSKGETANKLLRLGSAITQISYQDFLDRK